MDNHAITHHIPTDQRAFMADRMEHVVVTHAWVGSAYLEHLILNSEWRPDVRLKNVDHSEVIVLIDADLVLLLRRIAVDIVETSSGD